MIAKTSETCDDLAPDEAFLKAIFPDAYNVTYDILANAGDTCTALVHADKERVVLRLEETTDRLLAISLVQQLARHAILDLVPRVHNFGSATLADGREVEYSIHEYVSDCLKLEDIWHELSYETQKDLMHQLTEAMRALQSLDFSTTPCQEVLDELLRQRQVHVARRAILGGPAGGIFTDFASFFESIMATFRHKRDPNPPQLRKDSSGITLHAGGDSICFSNEQIIELESSARLCHNDLEPRKILIRRSSTNNDQYQLAAMIDWEFAGFSPFSNEYQAKDFNLGNGNYFRSWYTLFKSETKSLLQSEKEVEPSQAQQLLMKALALVQKPYEERMQTNPGVAFRKRWLEREDMVVGDPAWHGWVARDTQCLPKLYTRKENDDMEVEVLEKLGHKWY